MCCDLGDGSYELWVDDSLVKKGAHLVTFESTNYPSCSRPHISIEIVTDGFGNETYWDIRNSQGDVLVGVRRETCSSEESYTDTFCLPQSDPFEFTVRDVEGDGL